jgi:hypothetical protein
MECEETEAEGMIRTRNGNGAWILLGLISFCLLGLSVSRGLALAEAPAPSGTDAVPYLLPEPTETSFEAYRTLRPRLLEDEKEKIEYLLNRIRNSGCQFFRNEEIVSGGTAVNFLRWKRMRPQFRNFLKSARDFVEKITNRSEMSGQYYEVIFPDGRRFHMIDVMRKELDFLENQGNPETESLTLEKEPR